MFGSKKKSKFSFGGSNKSKESLGTSSDDDQDDDRSSRSLSRVRSISPFRRATSQARGKRDASADSSRSESRGRMMAEENHEKVAYSEEKVPDVCPATAFETDESDSDDDYEEEDDPELDKNTYANASAKTPFDFLSQEPEMMTFSGEGPNLVSEDGPSFTNTPRAPRRRMTKSGTTQLDIEGARPVFERNRCTVTLKQGNPDEFKAQRKTKSYLVASDLSEEALYAIQWAIGTVLRQGDDLLVCSVMETDSKLDVDDPSSEQKKAKIANQKERQLRALALSRSATALLERTRLNVTYCQAIHAKNSRHMLVDMIDYREPTLVIVGSRGLTAMKGMLLGSVSNYLVQKSSSPVMVTRRPLRLARQIHRPKKLLNRGPRMTLAEAQIDKESHGGAVDTTADADKEVDDADDSLAKMKLGLQHGEKEEAHAARDEPRSQ